MEEVRLIHMKKKLYRIFAVLIAVLIIITIYLVFIRSWHSSLDAELEIDLMRNVSYFNSKTQSECKKTLTAIYTQCSDTTGSNFMQSDSKNGFERWSDLDLKDNGPVLHLYYTFSMKTDKEITVLETSVDAFIISDSDFSFNCFNGPDINLPINNGPPYLISDYNKEFGKFRPIFNLMSKHSKEVNFEYYISPLISTKDDIGLPTFSGDGADMVFVCNEYTVYVHESSLYEFEYRYKDVIADLVVIFNQAKAAES